MNKIIVEILKLSLFIISVLTTICNFVLCVTNREARYHNLSMDYVMVKNGIREALSKL